jgi:hypothetical protein
VPLRLIALLSVALALRLTWAFVQPADAAAIDALPDQREYLSLAQNLIHDQTLRFTDPRFHQTVFAYRLPGYPLFVAACGGSIRIVRIAQAVIDTSLLLAVYGIARRLGLSQTAAHAAAALVAINPFLIYFSGELLTETLFTAAVAWGVWAVVARRSTFFACCAATAVLLRPTAILIFPLIAFAADGSTITRVRRVLLVAALLFLTLYFWAMRNDTMLGRWIFTTTNDGVTLYDGFNPAATGASDQRFFDRLPAERSMSEYDRSASLERQAVDWATTHPVAVVKLSAKKLLRGWSPVPLSHEFGRPLYRIAAACYAIPFDLAVLAGLILGRLTRRQKWLLLVPAIGVTAAQLLSVGSLRYRIPAEPLLAVLAATALYHSGTASGPPLPAQAGRPRCSTQVGKCGSFKRLLPLPVRRERGPDLCRTRRPEGQGSDGENAPVRSPTPGLPAWAVNAG